MRKQKIREPKDCDSDSLLVSVIMERLSRAEAGMVTAELAFNLPVFLTVAMFCVSGVLQATTATQVDTAARNAVRALSLEYSENEVKADVLKTLGTKAKLSVKQEMGAWIVRVTLPGRGVFSWLGYDFSAEHRLIAEGG